MTIIVIIIRKAIQCTGFYAFLYVWNVYHLNTEFLSTKYEQYALQSKERSNKFEGVLDKKNSKLEIRNEHEEKLEKGK